MIEICYAIILGFAVIGSGILAVSQIDRRWNWLSLVLVVILPVIHIALTPDTIFMIKEVIVVLTLNALTTHLGYFLIGASLAMLLVFHEEGVYHRIWGRIDPANAPTASIKAGQRGQQNVQTKLMPSTLMGSSTGMFSVQGLDVKTVALVRLALAAFSKIDSRSVIGIESSLKLGDGRRYKAFHKLVSECQMQRSNIKDIVHPYWREINGNHASARNMFTLLCQLARDTQNTDKKTVNRLVKIGKALGLSPRDMGLAISQIKS